MPAVPTKLFDVRNGNNSTDSDTTTYPRATFIVFKDDAAKNTVIDAFCQLGSYTGFQADGVTPISKQAFFNRELQQIIRDRIRQAREATARAAIVVA